MASSVIDSRVFKFIEINFQERPEFLPEWANLILNDPIAFEALDAAIRNIPENCLPQRNCILKALTYQPPSRIKAIIVARAPIPNASLNTGLAFSYPLEPVDDQARYFYNNIERMVKGENTHDRRGISMARMKQALMAAGLETVNDTGNFDYEHWAERGVLLWNSCLTYDPATKPKDCDMFWLPFTKRLISLVLQTSIHKPVLGMFWGTPAKEVYESVVSDVARGVAQSVVKSIPENVAWQMKSDKKLGNVLYAAKDAADGVYDKVAQGMRLALEGCLIYSNPTFQIRGYPDFLTAASEQFASRPELFRPASEADADQGVNGLTGAMGAMGI